MLALFGTVTAGPPILLGVLGWKRGHWRWMSVVAMVLAGLLVALYLLAIVLARPGHGV